MSKSSKSQTPSVLIVPTDSGNVFIVENQQSESQIDKILKAPPLEDSQEIFKESVFIK